MTSRSADGPEGTDWTPLATALLEREVAAAEGDGAALRAAEEYVITAERQFELALDAGPLSEIAVWCDLEPAEARVLALCTAVELDRRLQRLVDALAGGGAGGRPTVDLLVRLLGPEALAALLPPLRSRFIYMARKPATDRMNQ